MTELAGIILYDIEEISNFLGCSRFTANRLCRERRIKATKVCNGWKATKEALENCNSWPDVYKYARERMQANNWGVH